ncbi:hypothetical protein L6164_034165 [Bauhinia variegata]|uniref:Uncharacterized protein n=1 Tax=Bauhinia variegata TaxID=167791 RepID=A0ACB9KUT7_BAUVA|nr:hypothetical protein L6164_034165 [Bauhinia variegata]
MDNWRRSESRHRGGQWNRSFNRRPAFDTWRLTVPAWEKRFCASVGRVPWGKIVDAQRCMLYLYDNVVKWDDSAGREAFDNAKKRYWAEINGLPCNISLPDPHIYIEDVDWSSSIDQELVEDLDKERKFASDSEKERDSPSEEVKEEKVEVLGNSLLSNQNIIPTGWGDSEDGWGDAEGPTSTPTQGWDPSFPVNVTGGPWQQCCTYNEPAEQYGWQNNWNHSWGWNQRDQYYGTGVQKMGKGRGGGNWGAWDGHYRRRENMSWHNNSAYQGDDHQANRGRKYHRGRRKGNFGGDRQYREKIRTN